MAKGCLTFIVSAAAIYVVYVVSAADNWRILEWLILPLALLCGVSLLLVFAVTLQQMEREDEVEKLESLHHNISQAEADERLALTMRARAYGFGTPECEALMAQVAELEKEHQRRWNRRVNEIVNKKFPVPDEEFERLEAERKKH